MELEIKPYSLLHTVSGSRFAADTVYKSLGTRPCSNARHLQWTPAPTKHYQIMSTSKSTIHKQRGTQKQMASANQARWLKWNCTRQQWSDSCCSACQHGTRMPPSSALLCTAPQKRHRDTAQPQTKARQSRGSRERQWQEPGWRSASQAFLLLQFSFSYCSIEFSLAPAAFLETFLMFELNRIWVWFWIAEKICLFLEFCKVILKFESELGSVGDSNAFGLVYLESTLSDCGGILSNLI